MGRRHSAPAARRHPHAQRGSARDRRHGREEGQPFGYDDYWDDNGVFHYFGAGQVGDMEFVRGNRALRDHAEAGEDVHVFEHGAGGLRYTGQFVCAGYDERDDVPDRNGDLRRAIVFELVALDDQLVGGEPSTGSVATSEARWTMSLESLRDRASRTVGQETSSTEAKRRVYQRSGDLKVYVLRRADGSCEGCDQAAPFVTKAGRPYLEPHHTRRLSDGGPDDYHHVIALCPTCHRRVHHGADGDSYNAQLRNKLKAIEPM
jgi:5-methylcytosine-specific restriction protein A